MTEFKQPKYPTPEVPLSANPDELELQRHIEWLLNQIGYLEYYISKYDVGYLKRTERDDINLHKYMLQRCKERITEERSRLLKLNS